MPKVQINRLREHETTKGSTDGPVEVVKWVDPLVNVNWRNSPDGTGHVQLSFDVPLGYLETVLASANGDIVSGSSLVWSPVLERDELNLMIRTLRKARDNAYGADA